MILSCVDLHNNAGISVVYVADDECLLLKGTVHPKLKKIDEGFKE